MRPRLIEMNRIILFIILSLAVNTNGFAQEIVEQTSTNDTIAWHKLNTDKFIIKHPETWTMDTTGLMGSTFILFSPVSGDEDKFRENVNLVVQNITGFNLDLDKFIAISEQQIKALITDAELVVNEKVEKENTTHQKLIYSGRQGIYSLKFLQHCWVINDMAYVLTMTCEIDQFDTYLKTGEQILDSFLIMQGE